MAESPHPRRMRFERHASRVAFDPSLPGYVATWSKCGIPDAERLSRCPDPSIWIPSIEAMATLYDRGAIPLERTVCAGKSVAAAWNAGDRRMLDSGAAKGAAEMVRDMSMSGASGEMDMMQAMRTLSDEIAAVRFAETPRESLCDESALHALAEAGRECLSIPGFAGWPPKAMRRRLLYRLGRRRATDWAYTLISAMFGVGAGPLLSLRDRSALWSMAEAAGIPRTVAAMPGFFGFAAGKLIEMKDAGLSRMEASSVPVVVPTEAPAGADSPT